jgi:hypothetical protein
VRKSFSSWLIATARAKGIHELSTGTLDLIHRPVSALCEKANQALEPLTNHSLLKTGAMEAASKH